MEIFKIELTVTRSPVICGEKTGRLFRADCGNAGLVGDYASDILAGLYRIVNTLDRVFDAADGFVDSLRSGGGTADFIEFQALETVKKAQLF
jgi:hypothetical protein